MLHIHNSLSEFGVPSLPTMKTLEAFLPENEAAGKHWHPQSKALQQHNKAGSYERRLAILMNENFRINSDLES
jgi:beta-mannosidase